MFANIGVISSVPFDSDASAFIKAANLSTKTEKDAIKTLVSDLKTNLLWDKFYAIYPFVGSSVDSCKYNLKDPRDLDAAFRITFNGGWTYDGNGVLGNGTTGYMNTHLVPSSAMTIYDTHFSVFIQNNVAAQYLEFGCYDGTNYIDLASNWNDFSTFNRCYDGTTGIQPTVIVADSRGFWLSSITASNNLVLYRNGSSIASFLSALAGSLPTVAMYFGAINITDSSQDKFSAHQYIIASMGKGLTSGESSTLNTIFNTFKTALGR